MILIELIQTPPEPAFQAVLKSEQGERLLFSNAMHTTLQIRNLMARLQAAGHKVQLCEATQAVLDDIIAGDQDYPRYFKLAVAQLTPEQRAAFAQA